MKLIKRTQYITLLWLIPSVIIGSIFTFNIIRFISYEEADEYLTYQIQHLVDYHHEHNTLPEYNNIAEIRKGVKFDTPIFRDTMIFEPGDNEFNPYRELLYTMYHNGEPQTMVLRYPMPGTDDVWEGTIIINLGLIGLFVLVTFLMVNQISVKVWQPFYKTLRLITGYKITDSIPEFPQTDIDEFTKLNISLAGLLHKINDDYQRTKEFNGNASHELQSHLAIIRANTEKLINQTNGSADFNEALQTIYNTTIKLATVQKSLLLLSKIGNMEYSNPTNINLAITAQQTLELFGEAISIRNIDIRQQIDDCYQLIDEGLAQILINNLIKNSVKHNIDNGFIDICITSNDLIIRNSGQAHKGEPSDLMKRYVTGENGNMGIGLAITKQICDLYGYAITYTIDNESTHCISIQFAKHS